MAKTKSTKVTKKVTKETAKKAPKKETGYSFEVNVNDSTFKTQAESLHEALAEFIKSPEYPFNVKTRVFIKYGNVDKTITRVFPVFMARRIFSIMSHKDSAVEILARKLTDRLDE